MIKVGWLTLALLLPPELEPLPLLPSSEVAGLATTSYLVRAEPPRVLAFLQSETLQQATGGCQVLPQSDADYWLCVSERYLLSYEVQSGVGLWTQTERLGKPLDVTDFQRVRWQSGEVQMQELATPMFAIYQRLLREQRQQGAQLQELERTRENFVQRWRHPGEVVIFVGWQVEPGRVVLTTARRAG